MKKSVLYLCAGLLMVSLTACRNDDMGGSSQPSASQGSQPSGSQTGSEAGTEASPAPDASNDHDYSQGWTEEMQAVKQAVVDELGDDYLPSMALTPDLLEMETGLTSDMYEDYLAEVPMISVNVDTLLIIRAKNDTVDKVEEALNAYREKSVSNTMQYPMNGPKIQASRVVKIGNYVCFVQLGADVFGALEENGAGDSDEAAIKYCQDVNDSVIEILRQQLE